MERAIIIKIIIPTPDKPMPKKHHYILQGLLQNYIYHHQVFSAILLLVLYDPVYIASRNPYHSENKIPYQLFLQLPLGFPNMYPSTASSLPIRLNKA